MKVERQKAGIFSRVASLLTHNWGLKLLALVLAIIVYHSLKTERLSLGAESLNKAESSVKVDSPNKTEDIKKNGTENLKDKDPNDRQPIQHR